MKLLCFPARWEHTCRLPQPWSWNSRCKSCQQMWQMFTFSFKVTYVQELLKTNPVHSWSVSGRTAPSTTKCRLLLHLILQAAGSGGSYRSLGHVWIVCLVIMRNPFSSFIGTFHIWVTQQVATGPFPPGNRSEKPTKPKDARPIACTTVSVTRHVNKRASVFVWSRPAKRGELCRSQDCASARL